MLVVKLIGKSLVEHVNFLVICLCFGIAKSKILLLFLLLKLSILLLVVIVLKCYGLNSNWVILVLHCIIFLSFVITQVPSISLRILFSTHTKHIEIRHHFIRDHALKGDICIEHVDTLNQLADIFTKPLNEDQFCKIKRELGMIDVWTFMIVKFFCMVCSYDEWVCIVVEYFLVHSCISGLSDLNPFFSDSNPFSRKVF